MRSRPAPPASVGTHPLPTPKGASFRRRPCITSLGISVSSWRSATGRISASAKRLSDSTASRCSWVSSKFMVSWLLAREDHDGGRGEVPAHEAAAVLHERHAGAGALAVAAALAELVGELHQLRA